MNDRGSSRVPLHARAVLEAMVLTVVSLAAGVAAGIGLFFYVLDGSGGVPNGAWSSYVSGSSSQMALDALAHHAIYEIGQGRSLQWTASTDSEGEPLDRRRHYRIVSKALPARFWSITLYDMEDRLLPNEWKRYSVTSRDVVTEPDGSFVVDVSPTILTRASNWIASGATPRGDVSFLAYLRMYSVAPGRDPAALDLPTIVRLPD
jgi:hypothetical protein